MAEITLTLERVRELRVALDKATPQHLETAESHKDDEWLECPFCGGEGCVDGETYTNYDDAAIGVQFFGVGDQFVRNEEAFRALWESAPALLSLAERHLTPSPDIAGLVGRIGESTRGLNTAHRLLHAAWLAESGPDEPGSHKYDLRCAFEAAHQAHIINREAAAALTRIGGERDEALKALAPFAKEAARWSEKFCRDEDFIFLASPDDVEPILEEAACEGYGRIDFSSDTITVGDLRRAAALAEKKEELG